MTNEEAIKAMTKYMPKDNDSVSLVLREAMNMAIKALEQEPCEDCISRAELLKAIDTWDKFGVDDTNSLFRLDNLSLPHYVPYIHYDDVVKAIKGMPSVQPKPKTDVLDKIRAEIHATAEMHRDGDYYLRDEWIDEIIDKYKATGGSVLLIHGRDHRIYQ